MLAGALASSRIEPQWLRSSSDHLQISALSVALHGNWKAVLQHYDRSRSIDLLWPLQEDEVGIC